MRAELRVYDRMPDAGGIVVDLPPLFALVAEFAPEAVAWHWVLKRGAYGHGEFVCTLEQLAQESGCVEVDLAEVLGHLQRGEYFDHAEFVAPARDVEVARFDASFLRLRGPEELVRFCGSRYHRTQIEPIPGHIEHG